jgi:hypothetical protein
MRLDGRRFCIIGVVALDRDTTEFERRVNAARDEGIEVLSPHTVVPYGAGLYFSVGALVPDGETLPE